MTEFPTERFIHLVTHPIQIVRRSDTRRQEMVEAHRISPRLSTGLLVAAAASCTVGIITAALGVLARSVPILLLGVILLAGGMAAASLEGLLLPEREEFPAWTAIKKWLHR